MTVDGKEVKAPLFVTPRYVNTGKEPIAEDDFLRPTALTNATGVVSVKLVRKSDVSIEVTERGKFPDITFTAKHLDRHDSFDVQYLLTSRLNPVRMTTDRSLPRARSKVKQARCRTG